VASIEEGQMPVLSGKAVNVGKCIVSRRACCLGHKSTPLIRTAAHSRAGYLSKQQIFSTGEGYAWAHWTSTLSAFGPNLYTCLHSHSWNSVLAHPPWLLSPFLLHKLLREVSSSLCADLGIPKLLPSVQTPNPCIELPTEPGIWILFTYHTGRT
jgi:hypothetical protein